MVIGHWSLVAGLLPGLLLLMLNTTLLAVATAEVANGLDSDRYRVQWVTGAYSVGFLVGCMLTQLVAGQVGLRRCFTGAVLLFGLVACLGGSSDTVMAMVPWRFVRGCTKGLALTSSMVLLWRRFPGHVSLWMSIYGTILFAGALLGAPLGGVLTSWFSWRALFLFQAPAGVLAALAAWRGLPDDRPAVRPRPWLDPVHFVLTPGWLTCLIVVVAMGQYWGWLDAPQLAAWLAGFVAFFLAFAAWGLLAPRPIFNLRPLLSPRYAVAFVLLSLYGISIYTLVGLLGGYLTDLRGYQWWQAGLVFLPALPCMLAAVLVGLWLGAPANRSWRLVGGLAVMALATWRLAAADLYMPREEIALLVACWGAGVGLATVPAMQGVFAGLTQEQAMQQAGIFNLNRFIPGFVVGTLMVTLLSRTTDAELDRLRLRITHNRPAVTQTLGQMRGDLARRTGLPAGPRRQAQAVLGKWARVNARAFALQTVLYYLAFLTGAGAVLALVAACWPAASLPGNVKEPEVAVAAPASPETVQVPNSSSSDRPTA